MSLDSKFYQLPTQKDFESFYSTRKDELQGSRLGNHVGRLDLSQQDWKKHLNEQHQKMNVVLLGFGCDEGVKRNHGRPGAREGPQHIRRKMCSLPVNYKLKSVLADKVKLWDAGDLMLPKSSTNLEGIHQALEDAVKMLHSLNTKQQRVLTIVLGGGHEIAYGHFRGLSPVYQDPKFGIFNFDAHFDLRHMKHSSSGTPFLEIAELCKKQNRPFNYGVVGIEKWANTQQLFDTADKLGVEWADKSMISSSTKLVDGFIERHNDIYLTICMDVFGSGWAPGVSAANCNGLTPDEVIARIQKIIKSGKTRSVDIAEVAPCFDVNGTTGKLAALMIDTVLRSLDDLL